MSTYSTASSILDAAVAALGTGDNAAPERRYVTIGEVSWDCDQLTVNVGTFGFSQQGVQRVPRVTMTLALLRCAETVKDSNRGAVKIPSAEQLDAEGERFATDADLLLVGIDTADFDLPDCTAVTVGSLSPLGPNGGLAGWAWPFTITSTI